MRCPRCKADKDRVVDSRSAADGAAIRRRRECLECFLRYTTYERMETTPLRVVKKDNERVRFDRERILTGMVRACEKLDVQISELEDGSQEIHYHKPRLLHVQVQKAIPIVIQPDRIGRGQFFGQTGFQSHIGEEAAVVAQQRVLRAGRRPDAQRHV